MNRSYRGMARSGLAAPEKPGRRLEVSLPAGLAVGGGGVPAAPGGAKPRKRGGGHGGSAASGDSLTSPMQGTIVKVAVADGDTVAEGDLVVVRATNECLQESFFGIPGRGITQVFTATFTFQIKAGLVETTWRNADDLQASAALKSWLYRIATNVCLDMMQRPQRRARPMDLASPQTADSALGDGLAATLWHAR